ncbi:phosphatase PAP2 family protein [Caldimonas sp. KR1-144]|uniref:phosphatase PAP2 family protein n=1 Tax=Caldimonas sp. KR1-144 TaxID=3400911 RepID=UPI003C00601C
MPLPTAALPAELPTAAAVPRWRTDLAIAAAGLVALLLWDASGWDLALVRLFGNGHGFAWREHWLTSGVLHRGGYWLSVLLFVWLLLSCWGPWRARMLAPRQRALWFASTAVCLALIPLLKQASATSCPWSLAEFGGAAHYVSHWRFGVADGGSGHCFPSGHASGALAFMSAWFAWRDVRPLRARAMLASVLVLGSVFGLAQMMRGAHYASHTLWTAWICWTVCAALHHAAFGPRIGLRASLKKAPAADRPDAAR